MARKLKCKYCKEYEYKQSMVLAPAGNFCTDACAAKWAEAKRDKDRARKISALRKAEHAERKKQKLSAERRKKELMSRSKWYDRLQTLVNQYVLSVRDKHKPCCTCGKNTHNVKYDAGHLYSVAARSDIRFELTNIHKQCSVNCNQFGSGMRAEYEAFIVHEYGENHLEWLKERKPDLKTQLPNWQDIESEIVRYRKLLRDNGVRPHV